MKITVTFLLVLAGVFLGGPMATAAENPKIRVLIFSGQNNHDWRATTPKLKSILEESGRFAVDITETPATAGTSFAKYDLLLSNWNNFGETPPAEWPEKTRSALVEFVRKGGGYLSVHAGGSSFPDWKEYLHISGGRWGAKTGHGPVHEFEVSIAETNHPVTKGLTGFATRDELWHKTELHPGVKVLATAFSAAAKGGSGKHEPVAVVNEFGKGRCFYLILGHDVASMSTAGFQSMLRRGAEWCATGAVSVAK